MQISLESIKQNQRTAEIVLNQILSEIKHLREENKRLREELAQKTYENDSLKLKFIIFFSGGDI